MYRFWLPTTAFLALAACEAPVPDSGEGVGFGDYNTYRAENARAARDAQLSGETAVVPPGAPASATAPAPASAIAQVNTTPPSTAAPVAGGAPTAAELNAAFGRSDGTPPVQTAAAAAPEINRSGDISDEQDFDAVSSRESIESDAQRIAQQRAQYQQVRPTALPSRPNSTGPNLVNYALATNHPVGQQVYRRSFTSEKRHLRACAAYPSPSEAQIAFLGLGGPQKDRKGLDPDGDGFACQWDPRPFRAARQG